MRNLLRASYNSYYDEQSAEMQMFNQMLLQNEQFGFNAITKTLHDNIGVSCLPKLTRDVEQELNWLSKQVGSIEQNEANYDPSTSEIDWNRIKQDSVLLPEFHHPIEFGISSLSNIMLCDRFRMKNNKYFIYVLRVELMFGSHVFENCSFDIIIPKTKISNKISMPFTFST